MCPHRQLPPRHLWALLVSFDWVSGVLWSFGGISHWQSPSYDPAKALLPWLPDEWRIRTYGAALIVLALLITVLWAAGRLNGVRRTILAVGCGWAFFAFLFTYAAFTDARAGLLAPAFAGLAAGTHYLGSLAHSGWPER